MTTLESLPLGTPFILYPVESIEHALKISKQIRASLYVDMMKQFYIVVQLFPQ